MRRKRRRQKNSELRVTDGRAPPSLHWLNVIDKSNWLSLPVSQSELIWKSLKGVCPGDWGSSRAANRELIIYESKHPCTILMYSMRRIDWAYQRVNRSWSAKVQTGSALEVESSSKSSANNGRTPVPLHRLDVLHNANRLSLSVIQSRLICTLLNLQTFSGTKEGCYNALCSELVNCDGLGDGDDSNKGWSK